MSYAARRFALGLMAACALLLAGCGSSANSAHLKPLFNKAKQAIAKRDTSELGQVIVAAQRFHSGGQVSDREMAFFRAMQDFCSANDWDKALKFIEEYESNHP